MRAILICGVLLALTTTIQQPQPAAHAKPINVPSVASPPTVSQPSVPFQAVATGAAEVVLAGCENGQCGIGSGPVGRGVHVVRERVRGSLRGPANRVRGLFGRLRGRCGRGGCG